MRAHSLQSALAQCSALYEYEGSRPFSYSLLVVAHSAFAFAVDWLVSVLAQCGKFGPAILLVAWFAKPLGIIFAFTGVRAL